MPRKHQACAVQTEEVGETRGRGPVSIRPFLFPQVPAANSKRQTKICPPLSPHGRAAGGPLRPPSGTLRENFPAPPFQDRAVHCRSVRTRGGVVRGLCRANAWDGLNRMAGTNSPVSGLSVGAPAYELAFSEYYRICRLASFNQVSDGLPGFLIDILRELVGGVDGSFSHAAGDGAGFHG